MIRLQDLVELKMIFTDSTKETNPNPISLLYFSNFIIFFNKPLDLSVKKFTNLFIKQ